MTLGWHLYLCPSHVYVYVCVQLWWLFAPFMTSCESIFLSFYRCCLQYLNRWCLNVTITLLFSRDQGNVKVSWCGPEMQNTPRLSWRPQYPSCCGVSFCTRSTCTLPRSRHLTPITEQYPKVIKIYNWNLTRTLKCDHLCSRRRTPARTRSRWCRSSPAWRRRPAAGWATRAQSFLVERFVYRSLDNWKIWQLIWFNSENLLLRARQTLRSLRWPRPAWRWRRRPRSSARRSSRSCARRDSHEEEREKQTGFWLAENVFLWIGRLEVELRPHEQGDKSY